MKFTDHLKRGAARDAGVRQLRKPVVGRAYELAGSGRFPDLRKIRRALRDEGYPLVQIRMCFEGQIGDALKEHFENRKKVCDPRPT